MFKGFLQSSVQQVEIPTRNVIFETKPENIAVIRKHLTLNEDVYRAMFNSVPAPKAAVPA